MEHLGLVNQRHVEKYTIYGAFKRLLNGYSYWLMLTMWGLEDSVQLVNITTISRLGVW